MITAVLPLPPHRMEITCGVGVPCCASAMHTVSGPWRLSAGGHLASSEASSAWIASSSARAAAGGFHCQPCASSSAGSAAAASAVPSTRGCGRDLALSPLSGGASMGWQLANPFLGRLGGGGRARRYGVAMCSAAATGGASNESLWPNAGGWSMLEDGARFAHEERWVSNGAERFDLPEAATNGATASSAAYTANPTLPMPPPRGRPFRNRFLRLAKLGTAFQDFVESLLRDEFLRRVINTVVLLVLSRVGYFIPLPGFDRRLLPTHFLSGPGGGLEEMMDLTSELDLSLFQLGIMPYIYASMLMQVVAIVHPQMAQMRKDDGHRFTETIKKWTHWTAVGLAAIYSFYVAVVSQPYSLYAQVDQLKYYVVTVSLLTFGSVAINTISERITASGLGNGPSLLICTSILSGYADSLNTIFAGLKAGITHLGRSVFFFLGFFLFATAGAVYITEGLVKVPLQYYDFELASPGSMGLQQIEPYIPFNINPGGMGPVMITGVLTAGLAQLLGVLGPQNPLQALHILLPPPPLVAGWIHYTFQFLFIFVLNQKSLAQPDQAQEVANYLGKIGARVPGIKPGDQTVKYFDKVQNSARFRGGMLLAGLVTLSSLVDRNLLGAHKGVNIGFTSTLIIVGTIISLKKTVEAYRQLPELERILSKYRS